MPEENASTAEEKTLSVMERLAIEEKVIDALRTVYDPEVPVNIYELGLIYELTVAHTGNVMITMTLTAPNCPEAAYIPLRVRDAVKAVPGVTDATVDLVFEPAWNPSRMTEAAKLQLGFF